jgi:hypothetical protein
MSALVLPLPTDVWGLFLRLLGVVYLIAFGSLRGQILAIAGSRGISPVSGTLAAARRDLPGWRRVARFPTLLWLSSSDWMLRALVLSGMAGALGVIGGGPWSRAALVVCWVAWLSLDVAADLLFPWDCLLFEAGFLALFLPTSLTLPALALSSAPMPALVVAYQLLLARLLVGFGKIKFVGMTRKDHGYLREFLINQPMPSRLGWLAHRAPTWVLEPGMAFLFVVEMILPFLTFIPGWPRLIAAVGIVALMIGIQLGGNFGHFNLLTMVLCVTLLDAHTTLLSGSRADAVASPFAVLTLVVLAAWALLGLVYFPFNSWCTRAWPNWPLWENAKSRGVRAAVGAARALAPFRVANAYGVFPPQTIPGMKFAAVIEGTRDGVSWREYEYRYFPTNESSPPKFIAPHHPRWDHYVFYDALGHNPGGFMASLIAAAHPYLYHPWSPLERLMQRLLEGSPDVAPLFRADPFADGGGPPVRARVTVYMLEPTTPAERKRSGRWWRRTRLSELYPERARDDARWADWPADPFLFHWDYLYQRRATPRVRDFLAAARGAETATAMDSAVTAALAALGRPAPEAAVRRFWSELIPLARPADPSEWGELPAASATCEEHFPGEMMRDLERVCALLAMGLAERYHRRVFGDPSACFPLPSYFHVGALCHAVILQGRDVYECALTDDDFMMAEARRVTPGEGMWLWGIFHYDVMLFHARRGRLMVSMSPSDYLPGLPGFLLLGNWVATQLYDEKEEALPLFARDIGDGRWRLTGWVRDGDARMSAPEGKVAALKLFGRSVGSGVEQ